MLNVPIDEKTAPFIYLKADALVKLNKKSEARDLYLEIAKFDPNFRMVKDRLDDVEG